MSDIDLYRGGRLAPRDARAASRGLSLRQVRKTLREADIDLETDVTLTKMEDLTVAVGAGMGCVVRVAKAQEMFEQQAPGASARLSYLADNHAIQMVDAQQALQREIRRM